MNNFISVKTSKYRKVPVNTSQITKIIPCENKSESIMDAKCKIHFVDTTKGNPPLTVHHSIDQLYDWFTIDDNPEE